MWGGYTCSRFLTELTYGSKQDFVRKYNLTNIGFNVWFPKTKLSLFSVGLEVNRSEIKKYPFRIPTKLNQPRLLSDKDSLSRERLSSRTGPTTPRRMTGATEPLVFRGSKNGLHSRVRRTRSIKSVLRMTERYICSPKGSMDSQIGT